MDRLDAMELFVRIVERRSFTVASNDTGVPRSTATAVIRQLESRLGVRLLHRTTRTVRPTLEGEAYYQRCRDILANVSEADGAFSGVLPTGLLRVEVQGTLARHFLMPGLPEFFERYPGIELSMSESERWIDLVHEGVDCALRYGELRDSDLAARQIAVLERLTCATPEYFERHGIPMTLADLEGHRTVGLRSITTGALRRLEFKSAAKVESVSLPATLAVTGTESYLAGVRLGLGIAQLPRFHVADDLQSGRLVSVLEEMPPPSAPVSLLYPHNRQLSPRVRAFLDWAAAEFLARR